MIEFSEDLSNTRSAKRRVAILDGAGRIFLRHWFEVATMRCIAHESQFSKGTLCNYHCNNASLVAAFATSRCDLTIRPLFGTAPLGGQEKALHQTGRLILDMFLSPTTEAIHRMVMAEATKFPDLAHAFFEAGPGCAVKYLSAWLRQQTLSGRMTVPDPDHAAEQFLALCQTSIVMRSWLRLSVPVEKAERDRLVQGAVAMFLRVYV